MSNQQTIIQIIKSVSGQASILTIPKIYIDILGGDIEAALFLSQCVYWSDKTVSKSGFWKSYREWELDTCLTKHKVARCAVKCSRFVSVKVKRANGFPTCHYSVNLQNLAEEISAIVKKPENDSQKTGNQIVKKPENRKLKNRKTLTETTQEITQKIQQPVVGEDNAFSTFEKNIGLLTPLIADGIRDAINEYSEDWVIRAIREAVLNNVRSWKYIMGILKRWGRDGINSDNRNKRPAKNAAPQSMPFEI